MRKSTPAQLAINTIRPLAMDAVQAANSGHPGTPMAMAPVAYNIWQNFLRFDPDEPIGAPEVYGDDRFFVYLQLPGDETYDAALDALAQAGHPILRLHLQDAYDLGGQFFLWEMATAVASIAAPS